MNRNLSSVLLLCLATGTVDLAQADDNLCADVRAFQDEQMQLAAAGQAFSAERFGERGARLLDVIARTPNSPCNTSARMHASVAISMRATDAASSEAALAVVTDGFAETNDILELSNLGNQAISYVEEINQRHILSGQPADKAATIARGATIARDLMNRLPAWPALIELANAGNLQWETFDQIIPLRTHALNTIADVDARRDAAVVLVRDLRAVRDAAGQAGVTLDVEPSTASLRAGIVIDALRSEQLDLAAISTLIQQLGSTNPQTEIDDVLSQAQFRCDSADASLAHALVLRRMSDAIRVFGPTDVRVRNLAALTARSAHALRAGTPDAGITHELLLACEDTALDAARALEDTDAGSTADAQTKADRREILKSLLLSRWNRDGQPGSLAQEFARRFPDDTQSPMMRAAR
jgi:hypothetical protein